MQTLGIIGAGKLGMTLAQLARKAGYSVWIAGSGTPGKIALSVEVLAPGSQAATAIDVAQQADVIVLAMPLGKHHQLPVNALAGKLVVDAMNYWWEVDGERNSIVPDNISSSEAVQTLLPTSHVVKALSHMSYHDLHDEAKPAGALARKAIAIAGKSEYVTIVSQLVDALGFDPLPIGELAAGAALEPGHPAFGANATSAELRDLLHTS